MAKWHSWTTEPPPHLGIWKSKQTIYTLAELPEQSEFNARQSLLQSEFNARQTRLQCELNARQTRLQSEFNARLNRRISN